MKSTGIVRKVDELGRVVLPIELRRNMGIEIKDSLEIFVEENTIILKIQTVHFGNGKTGWAGCTLKHFII